MFWDKTYAPSQNIEALLEKENATVEEFLDDEDILQECKTQKKVLINYFTRPDVLKRLVELITTEPSQELPMAQRFKYANMACEILTLGLPSLDEKILSDADILKSLYSYLENEPPLNPLLSSFFSKTFSMLFAKKSERDWFLNQQMCLQILEYVKSQNNFLDLVFKHFSTPVIPDIIMQIMKSIEGGALKRNFYEWLAKDKLVERLIEILNDPQKSDVHATVSEFLCDLIQMGRTMRQNEFENDSFEPAFTGSNPVLQVIESEETIDALMNIILNSNAQESAIISGISVVLTLMKPVVFVDEPNSERLKVIQNREKDTHEQILQTVISVIAPRLKEFNEILKNPPKKTEIVTTSGKLSPPFGMVRLQICRVFTTLLQTHSELVSDAISETDFFENLLSLFKQYCWNNFLHSEVEKCLQIVFYTNLSNSNSMQGSTIVNDGSFNKNNSGDNNLSIIIFGSNNAEDNDDNNKSEDVYKNSNREINNDYDENDFKSNNNEDSPNDNDNEFAKCEPDSEQPETKTELDGSNQQTNLNFEAMESNHENISEYTIPQRNESPVDENKTADTTAAPADIAPSALQIHVITKCKIVSSLLECWKHNRDMQSVNNGRRLGYMGHLIKIFKHITQCISEFEHIGALIESNLADASELDLWQSITNPVDGELSLALATQSRMLANCNAQEAIDYSQHLPKEFLNDNITSDCNSDAHWTNSPEDESNDQQFLHDVFLALDREIKMNSFDYLDEDEDDENATTNDTGHSLLFKPSASTSALNTFGVTNNPWDTDPFIELTTKPNDIMSGTTPWANDFQSDNFADFDAHFSTFTSDLGESLSAVTLSKGDDLKESESTQNLFHENAATEEYDSNANVENYVKNLCKVSGFDHDENWEKDKGAATINCGVPNDSENDYEDDDDGIWAKPVGENDDGNNLVTTINNTAKELSHIGVTQKLPLLSNGPSKSLPVENSNEQLLNLPNDIPLMPTNDTPPFNSELDVTELNTKFSKANAADHKLEISIGAVANNVEISPTS